ncbi:MAG: phosphoribosylformylglycinamidine cyclo-ligase [Clostridiales bacterium]|jgi:phosphoribosylformylglycinamidine cyclo-ligase|nr:phosphoribosylformylglycinamidine cyclo-ligase [Clostridiales bacterium]
MKMDYKSAGVDVEAGYKSVSLMKKHVEKTLTQNVLSGIGGFGGLFSISEAKDMAEPVLVSGTDGVGTKLKIAFLTDKHNTVGIDCVAMCVNDIICCGAKPLFFLDYIACGKNHPEKIEAIVAGIAEGCMLAGAALIGGETAEMPGFYDENEYDIAGFAVGIVDKAKIIDGSKIKEGDSIIGIASSGIHSNGFSLVRKILRPAKGSIGEVLDSLGITLGEALLTPTKIYVKSVLDLIGKVQVNGIANITGGGFYENIPRMFPKGKTAKIKRGTWDELPIFDLIRKNGNVSPEDMFGTFNMGIGMAIAVPKENENEALSILSENGEKAYVIGQAVKGDELEIC